MLRLIRIIIYAYLLYSPFTSAEQNAPFLTGKIFNYKVQPGDYLIKIGARYGVDAKSISKNNNLIYNDYILPGQVLNIDSRHIVPYKIHDGLLINLPQRMLYYFEDGNLIATYPVGLGKPSWPTPIGVFNVIEKATNKSWLVPESIQEEMKREGSIPKKLVPPGINNPLGKYWIGLSISAIGIHGTIAPSSVYQFQSHGCIRLHPIDITELFEKVAIGTSGNIVYLPILMAESGGKIFLEVHQDIYNKKNVYLLDIQRMASESHLFERIDWGKARLVLAHQEGVVSDITLE